MQNKGTRFSHIYITRGAPEKDSKTARFRLAKLCEKSCPAEKYSPHGTSFDYKKCAISAIESELGIEFSSKAQGGGLYQRWDWYFSRIGVIEMLDTITVVANSLFLGFGTHDRKEAFLSGARKILMEENLAYQIDSDGTIHPLIDAAFKSGRQSAISVLDGKRYEATAACIEAIDVHLLQDPPDYKGAIRSAFGANENLFKLMYQMPRLDAKAVGETVGVPSRMITFLLAGLPSSWQDRS